MVDIRELNVSFTGEEANTLFVEPLYMDADILADFRVMPGVVSKKKLAFITELEKIVRRYTGCGFAPVDGFKLYDRWIETDRVRADVKMCWEEFKDTVYEEALNRGVRIADLTGTIFMSIIEDMVLNAAKKDSVRGIFFGNRADDDPNYDFTDGLWTVHLPYFVTNNMTPYLNTGSGAALGAGDAKDIFRSVYDNQANVLKGLPRNQKYYYVNGDLYDALMEDYENSGGGDWGHLALVNGQDALSFRGIQIKPNYQWDEYMANDFAAPQAHMCLLTTPKNLVWATDNKDAEMQFKVWYDEETEEVKIKSRWKFGSNIIHPTLMSVGY